MEAKIRLKAIQRIYKDLNEITESPIEGLSIVIPDENNPFELRANILILDGLYKDILLHLIMTLAHEYPLKAPKLKIAPGQDFGHEFHHHVFGNPQNGYTICIDLLDHGFFSTGQKTGWTPAYTLSTILMQMQIFFAKDHDLIHLPTKKMIEDLKSNCLKYQALIKTTNGTIITHSYNQPYPPLIKTPSKKPETNQDLIKKKIAFERLTCYLTRNNPSETEFPLGYPMDLSRDVYDRINITPLLEILSYEGYMTQLASSPEKIFQSKSFDYYNLRTAMGANYNYWFPLYINETLYQKNKQYIFNAISVVKYGIEGVKNNDFVPELILSIFPCLMNKMIVALQEGSLHQSYSSIEAYCHFLRLFHRLLIEFPHLQTQIDDKVENTLKNNEERNKKNLGDMGEFLILLAFSRFSFQNKEIWSELIKEYISRQFLWVILKIDKQIKGSDSKFFLGEEMEIQKRNILFFYQMNGSEMDEFYKASKISNNLLLFNYTASRHFLANKSIFIEKIDNNYGVIEESDIVAFLKEIGKIKADVDSYSELLKKIGLGDVFPDYFSILGLFRYALKNSYIQGYNSFKISKLNYNFLQKTDYLSLLIRWFIESSEVNRSFVSILTNPINKDLLIKLSSMEKIDVFNEEKNLFPDGIIEKFEKEGVKFVKNVVNIKFFYFWLVLATNDLKTVPKSLIYEYFTLKPKEMPIKNNNIKEIVNENFTEIQINNILKAFSIVFGTTINNLFSKFKVLTLQTLCFHIRVFIKLLSSYPEIDNFIKKIISNAFIEKSQVSYPFLINLMIFISLSNEKHDPNFFEAIFKQSLGKNIINLIKNERLKYIKKKEKIDIIEILASLFIKQFNLGNNEEFQKLIFLYNIIKMLLKDKKEFLESMDQNFLIQNDEKIIEISIFHKKLKARYDKIEDILALIDPSIDSEAFLFEILTNSLERTTYLLTMTNDSEKLSKIFKNSKNCLFLAKLFWKTSVLRCFSNKIFEWSLFYNLLVNLRINLVRVFCKFRKNPQEDFYEIKETFSLLKEKISLFQARIKSFYYDFITEECVVDCLEGDFIEFLIYVMLLDEKKEFFKYFAKDYLRKYVRFIIGKAWDERVLETGNLKDLDKFFDPFWLKEFLNSNDGTNRKIHRLIIFLRDYLEEEGDLFVRYEEFEKNEKRGYLNQVLEKFLKEKDGKKLLDIKEKMIDEVQISMKEKYGNLVIELGRAKEKIKL